MNQLDKSMECNIPSVQNDSISKPMRRRLLPSVLVVISVTLCAVMAMLTSFHLSSSQSYEESSTSRNLASIRAVPLRSASDSSLVPQVGTVSNKMSFLSSWFTSSKPAEQPTDVRQNQNFVLSAAAKREQDASRTSQPGQNHHNTTATSGDLVKFGGMTKPECRAKFGERRFLPIEKKKFPPMLYTFPGSGNTWCRLLIEYATGIYTGSVYNDKTLLPALPGEFTCNSQVSAIKIHPHTHAFEGLRTGTFNSDANKCKRGGIDKIRRAILLIRDPFDSIWSEFQRRITQSHVGGVLKENFNWPRWQANAAALSHQYNLMWAVHHAGIEKHYAEKDILYIKYEDLKNKETRVETLRKVTQFLDISMPNDAQLECAFALADNRDTHRVVDKSKTMSKEEAYTIPLACRMWALFGVHAEKHGYHMWRNMDCSKLAPGTSAGATAAGEGGALTSVPAGAGSGVNVYPPIPRVNVGGQGEYDRKWVKPGQKLLDFYGHPTAQPMRSPAGIRASGGGGGKQGQGQGKGLRQKKMQLAKQSAGTIRAVGGGAGVGAGLPQGSDPPQRNPNNPRTIGKGGGGIYEVPIPENENQNSRITTARLESEVAGEPGKSLLLQLVETGGTSRGKRAGGGSSGGLRGRKKLPILMEDSARMRPVPLALNVDNFIMKGNSVDVGGRDKADMANWLHHTAEAAENSAGSAGSMGESGGRNGGAELAGAGITLREASQDGAVLARVGDDKPAWQ